MIDSLSGKCVLVTGATGFIGGHLTRRLYHQGIRVLALEHTPGKGDALAAMGIEVIGGDVCDRAQMEELFDQDIQIVMHIAAHLRGRPFRAYREINIEATRHLAEISAAAGIERFVFTSSIAVYGPHGDEDVNEATLLQTYGDPYGDSKIRAEQALQEVGRRTGLSYVIVRPGMVYGPGSRGWTRRIGLWAKSGIIPLVDGGRATAYPIYIDNLIDLLVLCASHSDAVGEIFNAVDDEPDTLANFLGAYMKMIPTERALRMPGWLIGLIAGVVDPFFLEVKLSYIVSQMRGRGRVINQKARDVLGWEPKVSAGEGLASSEAWLRAEGIL